MIIGVDVGHELWQAFSFAFGMTWEVLWALILGFALSAGVQAVVSKQEMRRLRSPAGWTATANYFVMDWAAVARDIFGGLLVAGALAAWVSDSFWERFFLSHHETMAKFWGPLVGPAVAIVSFVCSIGNVPL